MNRTISRSATRCFIHPVVILTLILAFSTGLDALAEPAHTRRASSLATLKGLSAAEWTNIQQQAYLKSSNTDSGDLFAHSVGISGDTVVVGAHWEDSSATGVNGNQNDDRLTGSGAAYVFVRDGTNWTQQAYLKASNAEAGDIFGYEVAISGDTIIVGAVFESSNATGVNGNQSNNSAFHSGAAYVFVRTGTNWTQQAYLKASNTAADDFFGDGVAVSGDTIVVTSFQEDSDATGVNGDQNNNRAPDSGAAYVFVRDGTNWVQQAYIKASNTRAGDAFYRVALSGDTLAVGAPREDSNATGVNGDQFDNSASFAGATYVFVRSGTNWSQQAYLKGSNTEAGDRFAFVSISGDTLVVSAFGEDSSANGVNGDQSNNSAPDSGAAYVFVRSGTNWTQQAYLKASNTGAGDRFGWAISVSGDAVVAGAHQEDSNATGVNGDQSNNIAPDSGAAYVFVRSGTNWTQHAYLKASNTGASDNFAGGSPTSPGSPVAVSGGTIAIGAHFEDSNAVEVNGNHSNNSAPDSGAAYVFTIPAVAIPSPGPTFTKITAGPVVTDVEKSWSAAWGDYDNDGFIDLLIGNSVKNSLYRNNRDGTFAKITAGPVATDPTVDALASWGDYDNDGFLDLYVGNFSPTTGPKNALYHNDGNGSFTKILTGAVVEDGPGVTGIGWGDYNNDGHLDLLVANYEHSNVLLRTNALYRNSGDGTFAKMSSAEVGPILSYNGGSRLASWADYDADGDLDALITSGTPVRNRFYENNGDGMFTQLFALEIGDLDDTTTRGSGASWFDYDNDGDLDVFLAAGGTTQLQNDAFYRNDGGRFTKLTTNEVGTIVRDGKTGWGSGAADYDNDGYLDLFVTVPSLTFSGQTGDNNLLYHNNGDGTFTQITTGSLVEDRGASGGGAWGDYNNDGFMDLVIANGVFAGAQKNFLYQNNGNSNRWLKVKLTGTTSNRGGVGTKVRVKATIGGRTFWQLRVAHDGDGEFSQHDPRPNFGLGDASMAETVRIEWLSGIVQEIYNVPANQILNVTEPVHLQAIGQAAFEFRSWKGQVFTVEASPDLLVWSTLTTVTNLNGLFRFSDQETLSFANRFYRVVSP